MAFLTVCVMKEVVGQNEVVCKIAHKKMSFAKLVFEFFNTIPLPPYCSRIIKIFYSLRKE